MHRPLPPPITTMHDRFSDGLRATSAASRSAGVHLPAAGEPTLFRTTFVPIWRRRLRQHLHLPYAFRAPSAAAVHRLRAALTDGH